MMMSAGYAFPCVLYGYNTEKVTGQEGCAGACCAYYCLASLGYAMLLSMLFFVCQQAEAL